jgi:hypothetical protein
VWYHFLWPRARCSSPRLAQRRFCPVATEEEQLGRFTARKSKSIRLYLYSGKLALAATYLRRDFVDCHSLAAGAPALTHVCTAGACGTKTRRGPPAALPGAGVWLHVWGYGTQYPSAAQRGHGTHCLPLFSAAVQRQATFFVASRFFWCRFKIRNGPLLVGF